MMRPDVERFEVLRLHRRSDHAWAVIALPGGWIAADGKDRLLMRLIEHEARRLAGEMTAALTDMPRSAGPTAASRMNCGS